MNPEFLEQQMSLRADSNKSVDPIEADLKYWLQRADHLGIKTDQYWGLVVLPNNLIFVGRIIVAVGDTLAMIDAAQITELGVDGIAGLQNGPTVTTRFIQCPYPIQISNPVLVLVASEPNWQKAFSHDNQRSE